MSTSRFKTTHWSLVLAAANDGHPRWSEAWEYLAHGYWYPLYAYARRSGNEPESASDLTQTFFVQLLGGQLVSQATPDRGRFRSLLLTCFQNFLRMDRRAAAAQKRGGRQTLLSIDEQAAEDRYAIEPVDLASPDRLFERRWAFTLLERALDRLSREFAESARTELFERLQGSLSGERGAGSYADIAKDFGMTEGAVKAAVHRLRQRFRTLLREEVFATVGSTSTAEEELRHIAAVLNG